ncbi:SHOCT domain-containing protein [Nocardia sp. NPDC059691]|uniref:SHOCT domain-containing protein n=1 Tax=Nocardia sp. NPDC059691 TaxID=3346908 RepID=UPI0036B4DD5F
MMMWYGSGMSGWGYVLMTVGMVIFWALVVAGIVAVVRYAGTSSRDTTAGSSHYGPTPQQILAERYARGEIDEEEFDRRMKTLAPGRPR